MSLIFLYSSSLFLWSSELIKLFYYWLYYPY